MSQTSASPAEALPRPILVWDAPVRVFHALLVLTFAGAWFTAESERWRLLHVSLGWTMLGLVVFRIVWGLLGTRYARFASFVRGPQAVQDYLRSLLRGQPQHHTGHNPAAAVAIVAMLALALLVAGSGWAALNGSDSWGEMHELAASMMLALVGVHVAAVLLSSWLHRENLIGAMITGRKLGQPQDGVRRAWLGVALAMVVSVAGFWWLQWQAAPTGTNWALGSTATAAHVDDDD